MFWCSLWRVVFDFKFLLLYLWLLSHLYMYTMYRFFCARGYLQFYIDLRKIKISFSLSLCAWTCTHWIVCVWSLQLKLNNSVHYLTWKSPNTRWLRMTKCINLNEKILKKSNVIGMRGGDGRMNWAKGNNCNCIKYVEKWW